MNIPLMLLGSILIMRRRRTTGPSTISGRTSASGASTDNASENQTHASGSRVVINRKRRNCGRCSITR